MAKSTLQQTPSKIAVVLGGVDEAQDVASSDAAQVVGGVIPFFHGTLQRFFGKKIIDFNPGHEVLGVHQVFSGVCVYGYFVETSQKLYYHVCSAPPDLRIRFATLQS